MRFLRKLIAAVPVAVVGALVATNVPTLSRYLKIRSESRKDRPMGVTTTPRSYVVGRSPTGNR